MRVEYPTSFRFTEKDKSDIAKLAKRLKVKKAEAIRRAVANMLIQESSTTKSPTLAGHAST